MNSKMYDVGNTANHGMFILAENEKHAAEIALRKGHVKKLENAKVKEVEEKYINDHYFAGRNLKVLLTLGVTGAAVALIKDNGPKEWRVY